MDDRPNITWTNPTGFGFFAHGYDASCAAATESIDVTDMVSEWAFGNRPNYGFLLTASDTAAAERKSFCSMDLGAAPCNTASRVPTLSVTYNTYPWPPTAYTVLAAPQSAGTDGVTYVTSANPALQAQIGNTDGAPVTLEGEVSRDPAYPGEGAGVVWSGSGQAVAPLSTATVTVAAALQDGFHYRHRVRGWVTNGDGGTDYGPWSAYSTFKEAISPPSAPTASCASYAAGTWTTSVGTVTCTVDTASPDGSGYWWGLDDADPDTVIDDSSNTGAAKTFTVTPAEGQHSLYVKARDSARMVSTVTSYTFGVGNGGILTPAADAQTQQSVGLTAQSKSTYTTFKYQYQAGTGEATWTDVPLANVYPVGSGTAISAWPTGTVSGSVTNYPQLNWNVAATLTAAAKPEGAVSVRVVFNPSGASWTSTGTTFIVAKTAFSSSAAQAGMGPGTVSLVTGDLGVDATDGSLGGLSVGRTSTNLAPAAASSGPGGVFGAGWTAASLGPDAGAGALTLNDASASGSVTLTDPSGTRATYTGTAGGTFIGEGDAADGSTLAKAGSTWQLTDAAGTITTWTLLTGSTYTTSKVEEPGIEGLSAYTRDGAGRVTHLIAPAPTGVTCSSTSLVRGCRALQFTYATSTTATGAAEASWGNFTGLITKIDYTSWDPAASAMATTAVANYLYDNTGHLRAAWDPRISPALKTRYTYDAAGRLATLTPPGREAWTMAYDTAGRLASVARPDPNTAQIAKQAVSYGTPLSGTNLPDVTAATAAAWGQNTDQAFTGAAIFPASHVPAAGTGGAYAPAAGDWQYGDLTYVDVNGRTVNTAEYGAGAWQIASTRWDASGNQTWALSPRNRAQALTPTYGDGGTDPYTAAQSSSAARANLLATVSTYTPDGTSLVSTLEPAHPLYLAAGTYSSVRVKTTNTYDQGSPFGDTYRLVTSTAVTSVPLDGAATTAPDTCTTTYGYDPIDGAATTGDTSGWTQGTPVIVTTVMGTSPGSSDIVTKTLLDAAGRAVESRMPESTGGDAGTTVVVYYTADASAAVAACRSKPEWAGMACQSGPKAQPVGITIPTAITTSNRWDQPLTVTQTSGTSTRTVTNGYDIAGRPTTSAITASPAADAGTAVPTQTNGYNTTTGDATTMTNGSATITSVFNTIGQVTSYTDADTQATTSTYDIDGNLKTLNDGKGTYTYGYDGTDANGQTERRGQLTSLNVGITGSPSMFNAAYDADGNLTVQGYPNGLKQTLVYDNTDAERTRIYSKSGIQWMRFNSGTDRDGHVLWQASPNSYQAFGYDNNGRLTQVKDTVAGQCATRSYTFAKNGNRTALATGAPATDGACQTSTMTTTSTTYDTADRDTNTGYTYDKFGRTLTVPATDLTGGGAASVGYYSKDMVATQTQGSNGKSFTLDPAFRLRQATDTTSGSETRRITNHYASTSDSPSWINSSINAGSTWTWQRNVVGIDGSLAMLQDSTGVPQVMLTNPHRDIVASVDDSTAVTSVNAYDIPNKPNMESPVPPVLLGTVGLEANSAQQIPSAGSPSWALACTIH